MHTSSSSLCEWLEGQLQFPCVVQKIQDCRRRFVVEEVKFVGCMCRKIVSSVFKILANDGCRSSTLFPLVTQLSSPPRCSTTGRSKSWLQTIHCSASGCCRVVAGRLTPMHHPLFVYWSLSRAEVVPDVLSGAQVQHHSLKRRFKDCRGASSRVKPA